MRQWKKRWRVMCLMMAAVLIVGGAQIQTALATSGAEEVTQTVKKRAIMENRVNDAQNSQAVSAETEPDETGDPDLEETNQAENDNSGFEGDDQPGADESGLEEDDQLGADESGSKGDDQSGVGEPDLEGDGQTEAGESGSKGDGQTGESESSSTGSNGQDTDPENPSGTEPEDPDETIDDIVEVTIDGTTTPYSDITTAWNAADKKTATITLLKDVSTDAHCTLTEGEVILDLNGHMWSYGNSSSQSVRGQFDLIAVNGGKLTIMDTSTDKKGRMQYIVSSTPSGACVSVGGGEAVIQEGTFLSSSSASIVVEGGTVSIAGGEFQNTRYGSAITVNGGTLNMSKGKVRYGSLTYMNAQNIHLEIGTEFNRIEFTGTAGGSVKDVLPLDCGFRSISSNNWITDEDTLSGSSISDVRVDKKPIRSVALHADPNLSEVQFSYNAGTEFTLTAEVELASGEDSSKFRDYEWYQIYNDGFEKKIENTGNTYKFSTAGYDAGTYEYRVCVKSGEDEDAYEEWASFTFTINPLPPGVITNNNYQTEYTYGDFAAPPQNGIGNFYVDPAIPEGANVRWIYRWYKDSVSDDHMVNAPTDVGTYILSVEASDANYRAVGEIPVTITPRIVTPVLAGTTSKVYDGTTEAKGVEVKLDNVVPGDANGIGVKVDSIAYNDINARLANRIVASGIELTGNKAGNYRLDSTQASVEASISKAQLLIQLDVNPNTEKINRPVRVTVTALNSDGSSMDNNWLKVEDVKLFVSGRNDLEEEHILPLKASSSRYGVYTAEYKTSIKGDKTFTVEIVGNANYEVSNVASDNSLTILEKTNAVMTLTADKTEDVVYGDEVTYTAVVTKENENDMDVLSGMVQFYENEIADDNKLGSAKPIAKSGDKVSITLNEDVLTAGDHKILAVFFGSKSFEDASGEVSTTVAKKQLTWDVSGLSASKAAGTSGEATVYGELKLDGLVDEGDVTIKQPGKLLTNGLKSAEAGSYKVTVVSEDKEWKFDPEEPKNYELPEGDPEITAKVNAVKELPNPPADTEDGTKFKLVMEEGISTVPEGLKNTSFNTPAKIEQELKRVLTESGVFKEENTAIYDVVLQVSTDEGKTWQVADYTNFPSGGLQVTLPYPGGTGRYTNNYAVAHMFSSSYFGKTSGQVEIPKVKKTDNGMEFTVTGLSPIGLAWGGPMDVLNAVGNVIRASGATTWDNNPILLYAGLAGGAALAIVVVITACVVSGGKKKKKSRR